MATSAFKFDCKISALKVSNSHLVAGTTDGSIIVFKIGPLETSKPKVGIEYIKKLKHHQAYVHSVDLSTDFTVTSSHDGKVNIYSVDVMTELEPLTLTAFENREVAIFSVKVNQDQDTIAACCDNGYILQWDMETGTQNSIFANARSSFLCSQFSPESPLLFASGDSEGYIRIHDLRTNPSQFIPICIGKSLPVGPTTIDTEYSIRSLHYSTNGQYITYGSLNTNGEDIIGFCDIRGSSKSTNNLLALTNSFIKTEAGCMSIAQSHKSENVLVSHVDGYISRVDLNYGQVSIDSTERIDISSPISRSKGQAVSFIDCYPKSKFVVTASWDGRVKFWNSNYFF